MNPKKLYRVKEAAIRLNCSESTVRRLITELELEAFKIRGCLRVSHEGLENYIKKQIEKFQIDNGPVDFFS